MECEGPGYYSETCPLPGILARITNNRVKASTVERCDACERYASDQEAVDALIAFGVDVYKERRMPRYWKITANFHAVGEVIKVVQAPNWQGGLRKGALALKADARLRSKKPKAVALTVVETTQDRALAHWGEVAAQLGLQWGAGYESSC